jgi:hypothetical protein
MTALVNQPAWSRAHARIYEVEPLFSMRSEQRQAFTAATDLVCGELDLPPEHLRTLREAENNLKSREAQERGEHDDMEVER